MLETPKSSLSLDSTKYIVLYCMMFVKIKFEFEVCALNILLWLSVQIKRDCLISLFIITLLKTKIEHVS